MMVCGGILGTISLVTNNRPFYDKFRGHFSLNMTKCTQSCGMFYLCSLPCSSVLQASLRASCPIQHSPAFGPPVLDSLDPELHPLPPHHHQFFVYCTTSSPFSFRTTGSFSGNNYFILIITYTP